MSNQPAPYRVRCTYLTCKAMMLRGEDFASDPEYQEGTADFTCNCTCKGHGPDGGQVSLELCSSTGRACFREY